MKDDHYLVSGSGDSELRVWKITERSEPKTSTEHLATMLELTSIGETDDPTVRSYIQII